MSPKMNTEFIKFEFPWHISKDDLRQLIESSKNISRRFWTTHNSGVLEWRVEFSPSLTLPNGVDFGLTYIDGPSESVHFECSIISVRDGGTYYERYLKDGDIDDDDNKKDDRILSLIRGETRIYENSGSVDQAPNNTTLYFRQLRMKVATSSFDLDDDDSSDRYPIGCDLSMISNFYVNNLYEHIEEENLNVRLISGDNHTFYCHRVLMGSQSAQIDSMFRMATTEEEKNGIFRMSAWTAEELRKILAHFYGVKPDLKSATIQQLMNIYDFAVQYGLDRLKHMVHEQLWNVADEDPIVCADLARFIIEKYAAAESDLNSLKYRCYEALAKNYSRLDSNVEDVFKKEKQQEDVSDIDGETPAKKMRHSGDGDTMEKKGEDACSRLKNELMEYAFGRIEGVMIKRKYKA